MIRAEYILLAIALILVGLTLGSYISKGELGHSGKTRLTVSAIFVAVALALVFLI